MTKFKVGDVVTPSPREDGFLHEHLVRGGKYKVVKCGEVFVDVEGVFNHGHGMEWSVDWFELAEEQVTTPTAESLKELIFSIRQEREQTLSKLKGLDMQEAEAILQLNALGFSLFEEGKVNSSPSKTVLYAEDIEEDMTDPKNWKVGDVIESLRQYIAPLGSLATITEVTHSTIYRTGGEDFSDGHFDRDSLGIWKFHSRPVK